MNQLGANELNLHYVGCARFTNRNTGSDQDQIAFLSKAKVLGLLGCQVEHSIGVSRLFSNDWVNAPVDHQAALGLFAEGNGKNVSLRTILGNHAGSVAGFGRSNNGLNP